VGRKKGRGRSRGKSGSRKRITWDSIMRKVREGKSLTEREREFISRSLDRRRTSEEERRRKRKRGR